MTPERLDEIREWLKIADSCDEGPKDYAEDIRDLLALVDALTLPQRIWHYQAGNESERAAVLAAAKEQMDKVNVVVPYPPANELDNGDALARLQAENADLRVDLRKQEEVARRVVEAGGLPKPVYGASPLRAYYCTCAYCNELTEKYIAEQEAIAEANGIKVMPAKVVDIPHLHTDPAFTWAEDVPEHWSAQPVTTIHADTPIRCEMTPREPSYQIGEILPGADNNDKWVLLRTWQEGKKLMGEVKRVTMPPVDSKPIRDCGVDATDAELTCTCGDTAAKGVLHRTDGPCHVIELPQPACTCPSLLAGHLPGCAMAKKG